jgi:hypothetical protein
MSISIQATILIGAKRVRRLRSPISVSAESAPEGQRGGVHLTLVAAVLDSWVSAASADSSPFKGPYCDSKLRACFCAGIRTPASSKEKGRKLLRERADRPKLRKDALKLFDSRERRDFRTRSLPRTIRVFIEMSRERELASYNSSGSEYGLSTPRGSKCVLGPLRIAFTRE